MRTRGLKVICITNVFTRSLPYNYVRLLLPKQSIPSIQTPKHLQHAAVCCVLERFGV